MDQYFQDQNLYEELTEGAIADLDFLKQVDNYPSLYGGPILNNAIRRYECFWLPLVEKYTDDNNKSGKDHPISLRSAPIDVAWVWHIHMLAPLAYRQFCLSRFGRIFPHDYRSQNLTTGKKLWQQAYPLEPFDVDLYNPPQHIPEYSSQLQYGIRSAAQRQSKFYYNVSLPHYKDPKFLKAAVDRYKHFLYVKKTNPHLFAVPCYDFDLIWHAHQLYPQTYCRDTKALLGFALNHDDTETGRVPGSKLYESEMETRKAWTKTGKIFYKKGTMNRGQPLPKQLPKSPSRFSFPATHDFEVQFVKIDVHFKSPKKMFQVVIKYDQLKRNLMETLKEGEKLWCNSSDELQLSVNLYRKRLFGRKKFKVFEFNLKDALIKLEHSNVSLMNGNTFRGFITFIEGDVTLHFKLTKTPIPKDFKFTIVSDANFTKVPHVAEVLSQPKLMLMPKKVQMPMLTGEMTTNQIKDYHGQLVFNCKIVHSAECMLSAVEILDVYDNLKATAHVLDTGSFPDADEVFNKDCITDPDRNGTRAMLIRSRDEDYGVCFGKWIKEGITPESNRMRVLSFMGVKFYSLKSDGQGWCKVKKLKNSKFLIVLRSGVESSPIQMKVDLNDGLITIPIAAVDDIPQCLAIGCAISILHLLCRPYFPKKNQLASPLSRKTPLIPPGLEATKITKIRRRSLSNNSLNLYATPCLILASGYTCMTVPTNVYLTSCDSKLTWPFFSDVDVVDYVDFEGNWGNGVGFDDTIDSEANNSDVAIVAIDDWGCGDADLSGTELGHGGDLEAFVDFGIIGECGANGDVMVVVVVEEVLILL